MHQPQAEEKRERQSSENLRHCDHCRANELGRRPTLGKRRRRRRRCVLIVCSRVADDDIGIRELEPLLRTGVGRVCGKGAGVLVWGKEEGVGRLGKGQG